MVLFDAMISTVISFSDMNKRIKKENEKILKNMKYIHNVHDALWIMFNAFGRQWDENDTEAHYHERLKEAIEFTLIYPKPVKK